MKADETRGAYLYVQNVEADASVYSTEQTRISISATINTVQGVEEKWI